MEEKTLGEQKCEELFYKKKNYFEEADEQTIKAMFDYAEGYKAFLDAGKTERESVKQSWGIQDGDDTVVGRCCQGWTPAFAVGC